MNEFSNHFTESLINLCFEVICAKDSYAPSLISSRQFDASVVTLQNLLDRKTLLCQAVCSELAHADTVTPSATGEDESNHPIVFIVDSIDDKKLLLQTKRRTNSAAAD